MHSEKTSLTTLCLSMKPKHITSKDRLQHALQAIRHIEDMSNGVGLERFKEDIVIQSACFYQFAVVAEAMSHVDSNILSFYDYPWHRVKSFRNFILHEYHAIELEITFDTIKKVLPGLKNVLLEILATEFPEKL